MRISYYLCIFISCSAIAQQEFIGEGCKPKVQFYNICVENDGDDCSKLLTPENCFPAGTPGLKKVAPQTKQIPAGPGSQDKNFADTGTTVKTGTGATITQLGNEKTAEKCAAELAQKQLEEAEKIQADKDKAELLKQKKLAKLDRNWEILKEARQAIKEKRQLPMEEVEQVKDPEIKKKLTYMSAAQDAQVSYRREQLRLGDQLAEFMRLGAKISEKRDNLGLVPQEGSYRKSLGRYNNADGSPANSRDKNSPGDSTAVLGDSLADKLGVSLDANGRLLPKWKLSAEQRLKLIESWSLKGPLSEKLKTEAAALKAALAKDNELAGNSKISKTPAADVALDALDSSPTVDAGTGRRNGRRHYSLSMGEAEKMISGLEAEGNTKAANDLRAGIQEEESASLFDVVHEYLTTCVRQNCVISQHSP
jgi:hypothetical protein